MDQQLILNLPNQQTSSTNSSDSSYTLQTRSVQIIERPRLEHLKYYFLGKLQPFQLPLIALLIVVSLLIIIRKFRRKK